MDTRYFLERQDAIEAPVFKQLYDTFAKDLDPRLAEHLPRISFVMLKPDAYMRGIIPDVMRSLMDVNLYPAKYRLVQMSEAMIDNLYMFVKQKYFESWWIMKKVYRLGPTFPVLLIGEPLGYEHLSARVREIVGATTPLIGRPDQIRYRFRATHRIFNIIHATDDPAAAVREALVFFDKDELISTLQLAEQRKFTSVEAKAFLRFRPEKTVALEYANAKYAVKRKLFNKMQECAEDSQEARIDVFRYLERLGVLLDKESLVIGTRLSLREERDQLKPVLESETRILSLLLRQLNTAVVSAARDDFEVSTRHQALLFASKIKALATLMSPFASETAMFESNFDEVIGELHSLNLEPDPIDEAVLHAGWAVALNELNDLELKYLYLEQGK